MYRVKCILNKASFHLLVFCEPMSEFIRVSRCSRKTMVAFKDHKELYWFRLEPYV
jgi:hypothetical protein